MQSWGPLIAVLYSYINEKLECIFSGAKVLDVSATVPVPMPVPVPAPESGEPPQARTMGGTVNLLRRGRETATGAASTNIKRL
jgi:hypothetical protein